jgi:hypothetical protein
MKWLPIFITVYSENKCMSGDANSPFHSRNRNCSLSEVYFIISIGTNEVNIIQDKGVAASERVSVKVSIFLTVLWSRSHIIFISGAGVAAATKFSIF